MRFNKLFNLGLSFALGLSCVLVEAATKKTVCSVTINSNDEIETFKKSLAEKDFNFIELTLVKSSDKNSDNSESSRHDWLQESCRQGIKCDMLVISGHFGGSFFGSSDLSLSLETLERASCDNSCSGILHSPKEVFLFGCNTLAGKTQDRRTPEEYANVLVHDGFSRAQAQQIAAFRYSALGSSFADRMSRVFSQVPRIYGFSSIAPLGKHTAPFLRTYLNQTSNSYFDYLANVSKEVNAPLKESFKYTALTQTTGTNDKNTPVCYIENPKLSPEAKLTYILQVLDQGGALELAPYLVDYFNTLDSKTLNAKEQALLARIHTHKNAKEKLSLFVEKAFDGLLKPQLDILNLMTKLTWISNTDYDRATTTLVLTPFYEKPQVSVETADQLCSLNLQIARIAPEKIKESNWTNPQLFKALYCLTPRNPELLERVAKQLLADAQALAKKKSLDYFEGGQIENMVKLFAKTKYQSPQALAAVGTVLHINSTRFRSAVVTYVEATESISPVLRNEFVKAYKSAIAAKSDDAVSLYGALIYLSRMDNEFINQEIERFFNDKNETSKVSATQAFVTLFSKSKPLMESLTTELQGNNTTRMDSALLLLLNLKPANSLVTRLAQIIQGEFPTTTKSLSLQLLVNLTSQNPQWNKFFLDLYKSNQPYTLRMQALLALKNVQRTPPETDVKQLLEAQAIPSFKYALFDLLPHNWDTYAAVRNAFTNDYDSQLVKDLQSGKVPYTKIYTMDNNDNSSPLEVITVVIGLNPKDIISPTHKFAFAYGMPTSYLVVNKKTQAILAQISADESLFEIDYDAATRVVMVATKYLQKGDYVSVFSLNKEENGIAINYTNSYQQATENLVAALKKEKRKYRDIFESLGDPEFEYSDSISNDTIKMRFEASARRESSYLEGHATMQFIPGKNGQGTVKVLQHKVTSATN